RLGVQDGARLLIEEGLIRRAAALRHEEEVVLTAIFGEDFDLRWQVRTRVHLFVHRERRELAVAQVFFLIRLEDAARDCLLVAAAGKDVLALAPEHNGCARVLAGRKNEASRDIRIPKEFKRDEAIVLARLF